MGLKLGWWNCILREYEPEIDAVFHLFSKLMRKKGHIVFQEVLLILRDKLKAGQ